MDSLKDALEAFESTAFKKYEKRFIWVNKVMHLVDFNEPGLPGEVKDRKPALCGHRPLWPGAWWGVTEDATYVDAERGKTLPTCRQCLLAAFRREDKNDA